MKNNDTELIQRILAGDEIAFSALVKKYQKQVRALAWRKIGDFHIAEEITQDTFLKVYQKLPTLKEPKRFPGWIYVITTRLCLAWLRKKRIQMAPLEDTDITMGEKASYSRHVADEQAKDTAEAKREVVKKLLAKLKESDRTVITLYYFGEMTCAEIGAFLGISADAVKIRLRRARQRLKKEEPLIREALDGFQLSINLTENIMREIAHVKPISPSGSKPLVPWAIAASTVVAIFLMLGAGNQFLSRFQKPYSFDAASEMTVELIEAPVVLNLESKSDLRNQIGNANAPGKNNGIAQKQEAPLFAGVQTNEPKIQTSKVQWIQTKGPEGGAVNNLFMTSHGDIYARTSTGLYRLTDDKKAWNPIDINNKLSANTSHHGNNWQMTEWRDSVYVVTDAEVFISTDNGETWKLLGAHPKGRPIGLVIIDKRSAENSALVMYLALTDGIFRSEDAGKSWTDLNKGLGDRKIRAIAAMGKTVFAGTDNGLYRLNAGVWQQLSFKQTEMPQHASVIHALGVGGSQLYAAVEHRNQVDTQPKKAMTKSSQWSLYRSIDFGDSWVAMDSIKALLPENSLSPRYRVTLSSASAHTENESSVLVVEPGLDEIQITAVDEKVLLTNRGHIFYSADIGETWTSLHSNETSDIFRTSVVMLDANTFYGCSKFGIHRTMDGGKSWHQFNTGLVGTEVRHLVILNRILYANTSQGFFASTDEGESWRHVPGDPGNLRGVVESDGMLYASATQELEPQFFHLSSEEGRLISTRGIPTLETEIPGLEKGNLFIELNTTPSSSMLVQEQEGRGTVSLSLFWGNFAISRGTYYVEHGQKLFRWKPETTEWYDIGLTNDNLTKSFDSTNFKLAVSGNTVYVGKRHARLFQSFDEGNSWNDITTELPISFGRFGAIAFVDSRVYVATNKGVVYSDNGTDWYIATDIEGAQLVMDNFAVNGSRAYGHAQQRIYQFGRNSDRWEQVTPEIPYPVSSFTVDGDTLYVGTLGHGVLRFSLDESL